MSFKFYPETNFKQTEIGPLPVDWQVQNINDYVNFERGTEVGSDAYNRENKGIRFIRVVDLSGSRNDMIFTTSKNIRICNKEDILVTFDGSPGIVQKGFEGAYSSGIRKIVIKKNGIYKDYIFYVLQTNYIQKVIQKYSVGVTIKHASKAIPFLFIPLPPLSEQKAIAEVLQTIQEAKEKTEAVIEATRQLKKSMMKHLFTYGVNKVNELRVNRVRELGVGELKLENTPNSTNSINSTNSTNSTNLKETEIGLIPEHWQVVKFKELINQKSEYSVTKVKKENYLQFGKIPIIDQSQNYISGYWNNEEDAFVGELPVIIFGDHTRAFKYVDFKFVCGADGTKIIIPKKSMVSPLFFYYALTFKEIPSRGYNRHYSILKNLPIPLPPLPEQQAIAEILQAIDEKIEKEEAKKRALENLFKSMLNNLMSGKLRVGVVNRVESEGVYRVGS